jgi:predicted DNA-binding transcriptional regulator YafY
MPATILRQWLVLSMLPKPPRRIDTAMIESRLRERGIEVHRRTIQRDLLELADVFPIVADERAKPYGWRWSNDAEFPGHLAAPKHGVVGVWIDVSLRVPRAELDDVLERLGARNRRPAGESDAIHVTVIVTIEDTRSNRRLLLGHGDEVEVVAPIHLRLEIAARARRALAAHARVR